MNAFDEGLRCQDVHSGLRNLDPNSPVLAPLTETQKIGMAAGLASLIKGQDVVPDAQALRTVAAEQLDVSPYAFNDVVYSLERAGFVSNIQTSGSRIIAFNEEVPYYRGMYEGLGKRGATMHRARSNSRSSLSSTDSPTRLSPSKNSQTASDSTTASFLRSSM